MSKVLFLFYFYFNLKPTDGERQILHGDIAAIALWLNIDRPLEDVAKVSDLV